MEQSLIKKIGEKTFNLACWTLVVYFFGALHLNFCTAHLNQFFLLIFFPFAQIAEPKCRDFLWYKRKKKNGCSLTGGILCLNAGQAINHWSGVLGALNYLKHSLNCLLLLKCFGCYHSLDLGSTSDPLADQEKREPGNVILFHRKMLNNECLC